MEYGYRASFHLRSLSAGIVLTLTAYYAIIAFHRVVLRLFVTLGLNSGLFLLALLLPLILKGGFAVKVFRAQKSRQKAVKAFVLVSSYLIIIAFSLSAAVALGSWFTSRKASIYLARSHWFWVILFLGLLFGFSFLLLSRFRLIRWRLLQDLKAVPIVSPVFCFGGPYLWANNLSYASLPGNLLSVYSSLTMIAGTIFLFYLIFFAALNQRFDLEVISKPGETLNVTETIRLREDLATMVGLAIFSIGLYIFLVVVVDIVLNLIMKP